MTTGPPARGGRPPAGTLIESTAELLVLVVDMILHGTVGPEALPAKTLDT